MSTQLIPFQFENFPIRVVMQDNQPWWVAADVCAALDIVNNRDALTRLDEDEKGRGSTDTLGGRQEMATVNEPGLYSLIFGSRKPEAKAFKRWIAHEVLPSIRQTGSYSAPGAQASLSNEAVAAIVKATLEAVGIQVKQPKALLPAPVKLQPSKIGKILDEYIASWRKPDQVQKAELLENMMWQYHDFYYLRDEIAENRRLRAIAAEAKAKVEPLETKTKLSPLEHLLAGNLSWFDCVTGENPEHSIHRLLANWRAESLTYGYFLVAKPQLKTFVHFFSGEFMGTTKFNRLLLLAGFEFTSIALPDKSRALAMKITVPPAVAPYLWKPSIA